MALLNTFRQALGINGKAMVHGDDFNLPGFQVFDRVIGPMVALIHLFGPRPEAERKQLMAKTNTVLDFTCFEMQDRTQAWWAFSRPQGLVADAGMAARDAGIMHLLADTWHSTASHRLVAAQ